MKSAAHIPRGGKSTPQKWHKNDPSARFDAKDAPAPVQKSASNAKIQRDCFTCRHLRDPVTAKTSPCRAGDPWCIADDAHPNWRPQSKAQRADSAHNRPPA